MENLNIKELIHAVRKELIESEEEREKQGLDPLFTVDNLKIEVNFVVEKIKKTGGGINLKIVDVGHDVSYSNQQIHKITLELKCCPEEKRGGNPNKPFIFVRPFNNSFEGKYKNLSSKIKGKHPLTKSE